MEREFEMGMDVICIKEYDNIKVGSRCHIDGFGNLEFNYDPKVGGRKGVGFGITYYEYDIKQKKSIEYRYYFTEKEMNEYFITEQENYDLYMKSVERDKKISIITEG